MAAVAGAIIGSAVIGAGGSYLSGRQSAAASERNFRNRYQWQMKDMKKAGLNPMLAINNAPPTAAQPNFPDMGEGAMRGVSTAMAAKSAMENIKLTQATAAKEGATAKSIEMDNQIKAKDPTYHQAVLAEEMGHPVSALAGERSSLALEEQQWRINEAKQRVKSADFRQKLDQQSLDWNADIQPLLKQAQEYANKLSAADIPYAEAQAAFYEQLGLGWVALEKLMDMIPGGSAILNVIKKRGGKMIGKQTSVTRSGDTTFKQESYDYER